MTGTGGVTMADVMVYIECKCNKCEKSELRKGYPYPEEVYLCKRFRRIVTGRFFCACAKRRADDGLPGSD